MDPLRQYRVASGCGGGTDRVSPELLGRVRALELARSSGGGA